MRANKYEKINELMPDIKMSSVNAFVSHVINSTFIPRPVPLRYIVDHKKKKIHTIYLLEFCFTIDSTLEYLNERWLHLSMKTRIV